MAGSVQHCAWCGAEEWGRGTLEATEMMFGKGGTYFLRPCASCGSFALGNPPEDPSSSYPEGYYSLSSAENRTFGALTGGLLRMGAAVGLRAPPTLLDEVLQRAPYSFQFLRWFAGRGVRRSDAVLDVGSGDGFLLRTLAQFGFRRLCGIDPYLREAAPGPPAVLRRAELADVDDCFDVIMLHHVLEHVADPVALLTQARERLRPGGTIVVRVPLADSLAARTYGGYWAQLDAPRHLSVPTSGAVQRALRAAGLNLVRQFRDGTAFQFWGSEQYRLGIPLYGKGSMTGRITDGPFSPEQMREWSACAHRLNRAGDGDQGCFVVASSSRRR